MGNIFLRPLVVVKIQEMQVDDYDMMIALWKNTPGIKLEAADSLSRLAQYLDRNPGSNFVAVSESLVIGSVLGGTDGRRAYIYHLCVHERFQNQGIGSQLLERCLGALSKLQVEETRVFVLSDNTEGLDYWRTRGWVEMNDLMVMSLPLSTVSNESNKN